MVRGELTLREELTDEAFVGGLMRTRAGTVGVVVTGEGGQPGAVGPAGKRVQTRAARCHGGVQGNRDREQGVSERSRHGPRESRDGTSRKSLSRSNKTFHNLGRTPAGCQR